MRPDEHVVGRWIRDRAVVTPQRVAIDFEDRRTTYAELADRAERLAGALHAAGVRRGDRVATLTENRPEHVEVLFACALGGFVLVPLNWRLAPAELAYQLDDAEPAVLLAEPSQTELAGTALAEAAATPTRVVCERAALDAFVDEAPAAGAPAVDDRDRPSDDDPLLLVYTSGTTGKPKGALLTHANCFWTNLSFDRTADVVGGDVVLQVLPQFHVGGWNVQPLLAWWKGATVVLERGFDAGRALDLIERKRVTTMMGVPATYLFMAQHERFAAADLTSLERAVVGGAPMPESLLSTWHERGVDIAQGYGLTEAAPNVLCLPSEDATRKLGYAGKPYPHVEVALARKDGSLVEGAGRGELLVRGPNVFAGYWRNDAATAEVLADGWLHTGDVAERDDEGYYRIRDRVKDMFISGGENVYPAEVESVLHEHPAVRDAAVVGVPDERWGEVGLAAVVVDGTREVTAEELIGFCRQRLARFKVPKHVTFLDELPRNAVNKIVKTDLRDRFGKDDG